MERLFFFASGVLGFAAVALGAFGAHGLKTRLGPLEDFAQRMAWWETGAQYHLVHALLLAVIAQLAARSPSALTTVAGASAIAGVVLFSGSLYAMTLTGVRWLGAVTPLGGLCFLAAWGCLAWHAARGG